MTEKSRAFNTAGAGSESQEQQSFFRWWHANWAARWPHAVCFAIPNGGARSIATGARLKREGVLAGVPDILLAHPSNGRHGLFIEMKKKSGGRASPAQKAMMATLEAAGYAVEVCYGWQEAAQAVERYMEG